MSRRAALAGVLAALVPVAVGCGGGTSDTGSPGADFAPAGSAFFVSVDTSFDSSQWQAAEALLDKFPDGDRAVEFILGELRDEGIEFDEDVRPALGPEVGLAGLELDGSKVVGFTQPQDAQKLRDLLERGDDESVTRMEDGWLLVADDEATLDAFVAARADGSLSDDDDFQTAMGEVADDAIAHAYLRGSALQQAAESDPAFDPSGLEAFLPSGTFPSIAFALRAEEGGARFEAAARLEDEDADAFPTYTAELPEKLPAGALAYISFNDLEASFSRARDALAESNPDVDRDLARIEATLGLSLEEDIFPLFAGEGGLYIGTGLPIPEVTLVTKVDDGEKAVDTVDRLVEGISRLAGEDLPFALPAPTDVDVGGVPARQISIPGLPVSIYYAAVDGYLIVTDSRAGISGFGAEGNRLADDEGFAGAREAAGMPDETTGFAYVDLAATIQTVLGFAGAMAPGEIPPEVSANLEPLQDLVFYGTRDGNVFKATAFLSVD
jgi:hypothetical protein